MGADHCAGLATDLVSHGHLGRPEWQLHGRRSAPLPGRPTEFGRAHVLTFHRRFFEQLDRWARNMNHWCETYPSSAGPKAIDWIGDVGTMACHRPTAAHNRARGLDLCQLRFTDGDHIDMNASHAGDLRHQRRYLAVAANLRRYFGTVLTTHYDSAHRDHIHVDDLTALRPVRTDRRTDTTLIQSAANLLAGERLAVDGRWGRRTERAYLRLVDAFGLGCTDPRGSTQHAQLFLSFVARTAMADAPAGTHRAAAADPIDAARCLVEETLG